MTTWNRMRMAGLLLAVAAATVVDFRVTAQGARPPDIAGEWRLDNAEDPGQPPLADYLGIPFNEAGRLRADTTPESIWGTPEYQCRPHSAPHQWRGVGGARILKDLDPISREIVGYRLQFMRSLDRPIFMDGRPHPPAYAPHSWSGFSTGEWIGHTLKVTTTHLKDGYLKRGGPQTSDMLTMTEFITRHDDILTIVQVVDDPIYLDEPCVLSITSTYDPNAGPATENCSGSSFAENGGTGSSLGAALPAGPEQRDRRVPQDAGLDSARAGARRREDDLPGISVSAARARRPSTGSTVPSSRSRPTTSRRGLPLRVRRDGQVHVLPVQGNIYMLVADGTNITASIGKDGIAVVNTGAAQMTDKVLAALSELAQDVVSPPAPNTCFGANCPGMPSWSSPYFNAVDRLSAAGRGRSATSSTPAPRRSTSAATRRSRPRATSAARAAPRVRRRGPRPGTDGDDRGARERAGRDERAGGQGGRRSGGGVAGRHVLRRVPQAVRVRQRRAGHRVSRPGREHRRRQLRVLPPFRSDQRGQPVLDGQLSADRHRQGRHASRA